MAGPEAKPPDPSEFEPNKAHPARLIEVRIKGEKHLIEDPSIFPFLFLAYQNNRIGNESEELATQEMQKHLRYTPVGIEITRALDQLTADKANYPMIRLATRHTNDHVRLFHYDKMIEQTAQFLPPNLDAEALRNPYPYVAEDAA